MEARGGLATSTQRGLRAVSETSRDPEMSQVSAKCPFVMSQRALMSVFSGRWEEKKRGGGKKSRGLHFLLSVFWMADSQLFRLAAPL